MRYNTKIIWIKIFFILSFSVSIYANDILTDYRLHGIKNIKKQMDHKLTQHEYWKKHLEKRDTAFGYIESYSTLLTCNKEKSELNLYTQDENYQYKFKKKYSAFTGKTKGDKVKEGDLRTPIGVYQLTKKIYKLDSFYGPLAFVTSYPILIINQSETQNDITKTVLTSILAQLYSWRYSWLYNDINGYLKFYANDFIREDGMNFDRFKKYKTRIFNKKESKSILFNKIAVIPYPNTKNIYQITFEELYKSKNYKFEGEKTLMVRLDDKNKIKIFTEN